MNVFTVVALLSASAVMIEGNKCDPAIVSKIKTLLNGKEPKDLIKTAIANGKEVVTATTAGYYPADTKCLFSTFSEDSFTSVRVPHSGCPVINIKPVSESAGVLVEPESQIKRYHVFVEGGVSALYKCSDDGQEGEPEGLIKVPESIKDRSQLVKKAKDLLASLGINVSVRLPSACA